MTAQVAIALGLTKRQVYRILQHKPALRPCERSGNRGAYLWLAAEIEALRDHLTKPSARRYVKRFQMPRGQANNSSLIKLAPEATWLE